MLTGAPANTFAFITISGSPLDGVVINSSDDVTLSNVTISNIGGSGLEVADSANLMVANLVVSDVDGPRIQLANVNNVAFMARLSSGPAARVRSPESCLDSTRRAGQLTPAPRRCA